MTSDKEGVGTLEETFLHLGPGPTAVVQPPFDGNDWYEGYGARHGDEGPDGRLVSMHTFTEDWDSWEMHPHGPEIVICTAGEIVLWQEGPDGAQNTVTLKPGQFAINAPGVWHTADIKESATAVFITTGEGTEGRAR